MYRQDLVLKTMKGGYAIKLNNLTLPFNNLKFYI